MTAPVGMLVVLAVLSVLGGVGVSADQASTIWIGTWRLNVARSTFGAEPPPYKRATRTITPSADGLLIVDDLVRNRGGVLHLEWTGRFDGVDYPVEGVEAVLTNAYRCRDARTCDLVQKLDGELIAAARLTISPDGKTLTTVVASPTGGVATVYERQAAYPP